MADYSALAALKLQRAVDPARLHSSRSNGNILALNIDN
jgi:hypothetical protein